MTKASLALLAAPLVLAACMSPQERCIASANRDLVTLNRLISETEANLARGYAIEEVRREDEVYRPCRAADGSIVGCWVPIVTTEQRPRAVDLDAEAAKLKSMQRKSAELQRASAAAIRQCQAQFPE